MRRSAGTKRRSSGQEGLMLVEVLVGMVILNVGVLTILYGVLTLTKQDLRRDDRVEAAYIANYLLAEIMAKEYSSVYDSSTARGTNGAYDDLGYDRTPDDPHDTDYLDLSNIAPDIYSDNDGIRNEDSLGEGDGQLTRREWDDVDDYHNFTWGPQFTDEWGVTLSGTYSDFLARVKVESVNLTDLSKTVVWNAATGAKLITVSVLHRGDTVVVESGVKLDDMPY